MKKVLHFSSILCGILAVSAVVLGVGSIFSKSFFIGWSLFSMAKSGTFLGILGNIVGIAFTALGFGEMFFHGLFKKGGRTAFIWGAVMSALALLSLIMSIFAGSFNFGDIVLLALPLIYTYSVIKLA